MPPSGFTVVQPIRVHAKSNITRLLRKLVIEIIDVTVLYGLFILLVFLQDFPVAPIHTSSVEKSTDSMYDVIHGFDDNRNGGK
jgi:hypothetical protein